MADSFSCPVCRVEFDLEEVKPRILNCSHSVCETCLGGLMRRRSVTCPVCRQKHVAKRGITSFHENQYVVDALKKVTPPKYALCGQHQQDLSLFCEGCNMEICAACLLKDHRTHDVYDVSEQEAKATEFIGHLHDHKKHWINKAEDVNKEYTTHMKRLEKLKNQHMRLFDNLMDKTAAQRSDFNQEIDQKVKCVETRIAQLRAACKKKSPQERVQSYQRIKNVTTKTLNDCVKYRFHGTTNVRVPEEKDICGPLEERCIGSPAQNDRQGDGAVTQTVLTTFFSPHEVCCLLVLSNATFVVGFGDIEAGRKIIHWIAQYDMRGEEVATIECNPSVYDLTETTFLARQCLALSHREDRSIVLLNADDLHQAIFSYPVDTLEPTHICSTSGYRILVTGDCLQTVTMVNCDSMESRKVAVQTQTRRWVQDIACLNQGNEELFIVDTYSPTYGQVMAYSMQSQQSYSLKEVWKIADRVPGLDRRINARSITTDTQAQHLYIRDGTKAVHKFTVDGVYTCTVL